MDHGIALTSLAACVCAAALTSAVVARDPDSIPHRYIAGILGLSGVWALLEALASGAPTPEQALVWVRAMGVAIMIIPALCLALASSLHPRWQGRLPGWVHLGFAAGGLLAVLHAVTDWFVVSVTPGVSGPHIGFGWAFPIGAAFAVSLAGAAIALFRPTTGLGESFGRPGMRLAMLGTLLFLVASQVVLPWLGFDAPSMAPLAVIGIGGGAWLLSMRVGPTAIPPNAFARQILDLLPDGIVLLRGDGRIRLANRSLARLVEVPPEELLGCPVSDVLSELPPREAETTSIETRIRPAISPSRPVSVSASTLCDRQGFELGTVLSIRDQREVVGLRRRIVTAGRLAAVGELAAGIAHEVNNPISFIQANLNLLQRHYEALYAKADGIVAHADEGIPDWIDSCLRRVTQVVSIVREVRGFSHGGGDASRPVDLHAVLESALRLADSQLRGRIEVEREFGDIPQPDCVEQDLKQVFLDLLLNAAEAIEGPGTIRLVTESEGGTVKVRVEDDGRGMSRELLEGLFEPLATDRALDEGRGLGLSASYQILRRHGGSLTVDSTPGRGTRVCVALPLSEEAV